MKVLGITTPQEVFVGSRERNFRINEFLIIEDKAHGDVLGEVVEAKTYNRYLPLDLGGDFVDDDVLKSLSHLGFNVDEDTIYIAPIVDISLIGDILPIGDIPQRALALRGVSPKQKLKIKNRLDRRLNQIFVVNSVSYQSEIILRGHTLARMSPITFCR